MAGVNEILKFGQTASNILSQVAYDADSQRSNGVSGVARANLQNKFQRQVSTIAAGIAQFIADYNSSSDDVTDTLIATDLEALFLDALSNAPITTQPQFSNNQKAANTAFVQRALGSFSGSSAISSSTVLTASDVGKALHVGANSINIELPLLANVPVGAQITICANGHSSVFIDSQSPDLIANGELGDSLSSVAISGWQIITFVKSPAPKWFVTFGDAALNGSSSFKNSLVSNGYQYLPGGLIIQWGSAILPSSNATAATVDITFPIALSSAVFFLGAMGQDGNTVNSSHGFNPIMSCQNTTLSGTTLVGDTNNSLGTFNSTYPISWFLVGK